MQPFHVGDRLYTTLFVRNNYIWVKYIIHFSASNEGQLVSDYSGGQRLKKMTRAENIKYLLIH